MTHHKLVGENFYQGTLMTDELRQWQPLFETSLDKIIKEKGVVKSLFYLILQPGPNLFISVIMKRHFNCIS